MSQTLYSVGPAGILLRVKAKARAVQDAVLGVRGGELVVAVRAAPERNRANAEIARVLARALDVPRGSVVLKGGAASPHKLFLVPREAAPILRGFEADAP